MQRPGLSDSLSLSLSLSVSLSLSLSLSLSFSLSDSLSLSLPLSEPPHLAMDGPRVSSVRSATFRFTLLRINGFSVRSLLQIGRPVGRLRSCACHSCEQWVCTAGVTWRSLKGEAGKYWVQIRHGDLKVHVGQWSDELEAARAYDGAARRLRGDRAHGFKLNPSQSEANTPFAPRCLCRFAPRCREQSGLIDPAYSAA